MQCMILDYSLGQNPNTAQRTLLELGLEAHACHSSIRRILTLKSGWVQNDFKGHFLNKEHYQRNSYKLNKAYRCNNCSISTLISSFCLF